MLSSIQLSQPNSRIYTNHTISQREVGESSTMATKLLGTTSNQQNRAWNSSPPRRGLKGINSRSNKTSRYVTVRTRNFRILQPGTSGFSNQLAVSATCAKSGTSGLSNPEVLDWPWQLYQMYTWGFLCLSQLTEITWALRLNQRPLWCIPLDSTAYLNSRSKINYISTSWASLFHPMPCVDQSQSEVCIQLGFFTLRTSSLS